MKKTIEFVDAAKQKVVLEISCEDRKKGNHVVRDWETLEPVTDGGTFSICAEVANSCGKCDAHIVPTPTQKKIIDFWNTYHLNSMRAGTRKQMEALEKIEGKLDAQKKCGPERWDIEKRYLRFIGLLNDRGYEFGTDWLFRPYPKEELYNIIADIEAKEQSRRMALYELTELEVDEDNDESRILKYIEENLGTTGDEACVYLALARHCKLEVAEILDIEENEYQEHCYKVQGNDYYAGTEEELKEIAMSHLTDDKSMWIEATKAGITTDSLDDWAQYVIDTDGWENILNGHDGTSEEYEFITKGYLNTTIHVCRT